MTVRRWGTEEQVNGGWAGYQGGAVMAALPDGGFVLAWVDGSDPLRSVVRCQIFDSAGQPLGPETGISLATQSLSGLSMTALAGGGFVIGAETWSETQRDAQAFRFDAGGALLGSVELDPPAARFPPPPCWPPWARASSPPMPGTATSWRPGTTPRAPSWAARSR